MLLLPQLEPLSGPMIAYHVARTWNQLCKTKANRNKNSNTRIFQQPTLLHKSLSVFFSADHWSNNTTSPGVQGAAAQSASRENYYSRQKTIRPDECWSVVSNPDNRKASGELLKALDALKRGSLVQETWPSKCTYQASNVVKLKYKPCCWSIRTAFNPALA